MARQHPQQCRVWIINQYATPPDQPGGERHFRLARAVVSRGGDVTIFAAGFDHARGHETRLDGRAIRRTQHVDGVRFVWLRTIPYRGNGPLRIMNMLSFAMMVVLDQATRPRPHVVVGSTVHPFAALAGWVAARLRRARYIYEVRDLWPQTMVDIGAMASGSLAARTLYAIEAFLAKRAERIVTVLPAIADYLQERGLSAQRVDYLPNGVWLGDEATMTGRQAPDAGDSATAVAVKGIDTRRADGDLVVAWTGAHGIVNGLDVAIRAMAILERERAAICLVLAGDGPEKARLRRLVAELRCTNVVFLDPVPKGSLSRVLSRVDVGLIHATPTPVHRFGISFNKLFDYMAARLPIVFACDAVGDPVAAAGAGLTIRPGDPGALAAALRAMASMSPDDRRRLGEAGRRYLELHHDLARIGDDFADIVGCPSRG